MRAILLLLALALPSASARGERLVEFYHRYVQAVLDGDRETARAAWWPDDLAFAERLELHWEADLPKIDAESPLVIVAEAMRAGRLQLEIVPLDSVDALQIRVDDRGSLLRQRVDGVRAEGRWWLRHPVLHVVADWPFQQIGPLRVLQQPGTEDENALFDQNLRFIRDCAQQLGIDEATMARLDGGGLQMLIADDRTLRELVGVDTEGVANVALDMLLTHHPYHPHEIVHLLHGLALGERVIPMHPLLQEGLAVYLGGRWDSSAEEQLEFGALALDEQLIEVDALLDASRFGREPVGFSYAAAAVLVRLLHERVGMPALLELSRELRVSETAAETRERLLRRCSLSAPAFDRLLRRQIRRLRVGGFRPASEPRRAPDLRWSAAGYGLRLWWKQHELIGIADFPADAGPEQRIELEFPELPARRIRIQPGEIGLYDLELDKRLAKRAFGFDPDRRFWDPVTGRLAFSIDRERIGDAATSAQVLEKME